MSSTKNPEHEAENPAPVPQSLQGRGGTSHHHDLAGQQGKKAKMAPRPDAPPGLEQDGQGNPIPFEQRTEENQQKVRAAQHKT
jgi:hypothetical protein